MIYRYGSICEPDIIEGFEENGHEVIAMEDEMYDKNLVPAEAVGRLAKFLQDNPADMVFTVNFFPTVSEVCRIFHIPYASWSVDSPVLELFTKSVENECNHIFLFDRMQVLEVGKHQKNTHHLPLAANIRHKDNVLREADEKKRAKYRSGLSFVGSLYSEKSPYDGLDMRKVSAYTKGYLEGLMAAQEQVYGWFFLEEALSDEAVRDVAKNAGNFYPVFSNLHDETYLTDKALLAQFYMGNKIAANERFHVMDRLSRRFPVALYTASDTSRLPRVENRGTVKTLTQMPIVFCESDINLNITAKQIRSGLPFRIFDVLSCGGFLITNYQNELPEFFNMGEELVSYGSYEELEELTAYYLEHKEERKNIARAGYEAVKKRHSFPLRISQMLEMI